MRKYIIQLLLTTLCQPAQAQYFQNPILAGFYPDPSICRAGNNYYIVNSSFAYYPGLPIFHSTDLLNWQQIGSALNRPSQLNLDGAGVSRGLFAPAITYHKGIFYIICTLVDKGGNFVITATDPKGPWSEPAWLPEIDGIDPSIFFDDNDSAYIVYNSIPPDNITLHNGHRTIRINSFNAQQLQITSGNRIIVNGGTDMAKKPVWIEAPHLIKKDGWYYLICAEGGTAYNHSEVVFRTRALNGSFIPYEKNPILTQRHLDRNRPNPITTAGHADFVQAPDGKWWAVFLACRPYEGEHFNAGRETFMTPVEWKDGWPIINPGHEAIQYRYPINATINPAAEKFSGNYTFKDDFTGITLNNRYSFLRTVRDSWYTVGNGRLSMQLRPATCAGTGNPSFTGFRQPHLQGHAATALRFKATAPNEKAGLLVFQNESHYYYLCQSVENGQPVIQLLKGPGNKAAGQQPVVMQSIPVRLKKNKALQLKIEAHGNTYAFYYAVKPGRWKLLQSGVEATFLSTQTAGGFVGCLYALYASSNGQASSSTAQYNWFECVTADIVY